MPTPTNKDNPPCPDCGWISQRRGFRDAAKTVRRYGCMNDACDRTTFTDRTARTTLEGDSDKLPEMPSRGGLREDTSTFIITWAQNATPVWAPGFSALLALQKERDADLIVVKGRYQNPTSIWPANEQYQQWWDERLLGYLSGERTKLSDKLVLLADVNIRPTAARPLSRYDSITGAKSGILGHPKLEMDTIPTPQAKLPKQMHTTGAITVRNYTDSNTGKLGEFHHTFGALIVEVKGDKFWVRQVNMTGDGSFIDLDREYLPAKNASEHQDKYALVRKRPIPVGRARKAPRALALVMGDWHSGFTNPDVISATFDGEDNIVECVKPEQIIWHDLLDQYSRNHHHRDNPFIAKAKHFDEVYERGDLFNEVISACTEVSDFTSTAAARIKKPVRSVVVASNHDEALTRYIIERNWKNDPQNAEFYLETALRMNRATEMTETGAKYPQAFSVWASEFMPEVTMLGRRDKHMVADIDCGLHGDIGPNGSRGSRANLAKIGVKTVIGHSHTPGIREGCYQVGTSTYLDLEYATGPSSWLNTHAIIYGNGKRALVTIIGDEWRRKDG